MLIKTAKTKALLIFYSLLIAIIVIDACRKIDHNRDEKHGIIVNKVEKFFTVPANTDPRVKAIADRIKRQNDSAHFVDKLAEAVGYPVWNKALIASPPKAEAKNQTDSSNMTYLYIPFDNDSTIDATLITRTTPDDTLFRLLNDREYSQSGYDTTNSQLWNARNIFHLFAKFEKSVFGHNTLRILDRRLFPGGDTTIPVNATIRSSTSSRTSRTSTLELITMCDYIDVCYAPPGENPCDDGICTTECPQFEYTETDCFTFWVEGEWNGGGSPPYIPWGGGGSNPWYQNTCGNNGVSCGTPGWVVSNETLFLSGYTTQGYHHFEHPTIIKADKDAINQWKAENIDTIGLDSCLRKVLDKLLDTGNLIGKILVKMDRANFRTPKIKNLVLKFIVSPITEDSNALAWTTKGHYNSTTQTLTDTIKIKPAIAGSASEIGMAQILMHEIVHAYMKLIFFTYWYSSFSETQINNWRTDTLFNIFIDSMVAVNHSYDSLSIWWTGNPDRDHNFMADKMLSIFASALERIDGSIIANKRYYWYLAWLGLKQTNSMHQFWPNYPSWPPSNPAPNDDSTYGLRYALTQARIDSLRHAGWYETTDTANALGKKKVVNGCYQSNIYTEKK